ncbi:MAG: FkbM family methyltransferase [Acidimicrobiales bacterium]|nr:FkbM family methyltransferase [Acidimicrobiales bacterium]
MVQLPDGRPMMHDPSDWTCRTTYEGTYEREILRLLDDLLEDSDLVVDVGANVGVISAYASRLVGRAGHVIAIEPSPRCFADLHAVTDRLGNVTVVAAALGNETGTVDLTGWDNPGHRGLGTIVPGHRAGLPEHWFDGEVCRVPQIRLDDLLVEQLGGEPLVGLLKVDVEGAEQMVLEGVPNIFRNRQVRSAIIEVTTTLPVDWVGELLREVERDYDAFIVGESGRIRRRLNLEPVDTESSVQDSAQWNLLLRRC